MCYYQCLTKPLIVYLYVFIVLPFLSCENAIYLFNTEDNDNLEYYDCVILETIPYCRRPGFSRDLHRDNQTSTCYNNGKRWSFDKLRNQNVTWNKIIHEYRSSIEKAEEYALYLTGHKNNGSLCECQKTFFGKNCEYKIIAADHNMTFGESRQWQNNQKQNNRIVMQAFQKTLCYTTLTCYYGLLCLDWRDICDGRQQCMNGTDEEACDLLEFNECDNDEYRCTNGMCIPNVYFLDGEYDCMDHSDEQHPFNHRECAYRSEPFNCDEHICSMIEWSCGDGQCINEKNRYEWREDFYSLNTQCHSMREYMYICELSNLYKLWTSSDGRCYDSSSIYLLEETWNEYNLTKEEYCVYLIKCVFSGNIEQNCPCNWLDCTRNIRQKCPPTIQYPSKGLLTPYLLAFYVNDRIWLGTKWPDFFKMMGSIRCREYHAKTLDNESMRFPDTINKKYLEIENIFCHHAQVLRDVNGSQIHSSCYRNISHTLGKNSSYAFLDVCERCISQYRINDGIQDCPNGEDERPQQHSTCSNPVRHHRFQCASEGEKCLSVKTIGDSIKHCTHKDDEYTYVEEQSLSMTKCTQYENKKCSFVRDYIWKSGIHLNYSTQIITKSKMPFRSFCNTFWDLKDKSDESVEICRSWICSDGEYQCRTGQCIPKYYVCDGEWDCPDASDELFDIDHLSGHNQMLDLFKETKRCITMMSNNIQAFDGFCNISIEYPCLLINFTQQSDIFNTRPCINITQIGDNIVNCLGGFDERNTLTHFNGIHQLGFAFQCRSSSNEYIDEENLCGNTSRCSNRNDDLSLCGNRHEDCSDSKDFLCINGTCIKKSRCNRKIECQYGEDEYWCNPNMAQISSKEYRALKKQQIEINTYFVLPRYPPDPIMTMKINNISPPRVVKRDTLVQTSSNYTYLKCNRGVDVLHHTNSNICFCPPSYYGEYCEYHSDRLTSYVHLNVSHSPYAQRTTDINLALKVLVLLMYENQIIDRQQFYFRPAYDAFHILKKKHHLIYSRKVELLEKKIHRNWNRSSIIEHFPYSLQYEAYELNSNNEINLVGVWKYILFFDFLPSFRFAKTLRFHDKHLELAQSLCNSNPCNSLNAECHILQNNPTSYVCICKSGYSGEHCSIRDPYCENNFCHSNSFCKPTYFGSISGSRLPFCLCPLDRYGTRCGLVYDQCQSNPCKNNGTCYPSTSDMTKTYCICNDDYYGNQCELKKESVDLFIQKNNVRGVSVIQYFNIDFNTLELIIAHQEIFDEPSEHLHYRFASTYAPNIILMKNYPTDKISDSKIFFLSLTMQEKSVNSSVNLTEKNICLNVRDMLKTISVYEYHQICRNRSSSIDPLCFFDNQYLCFCEVNNYRAECFDYDHKLDRCDHCLSHGQCIRGNLQKDDEFRCLCPKCHYGHRCEFNLHAFGFTIDFLLIDCSHVMKIIYTVITFVLAIVGIVNNLCSFVTFKRPTSKKTSVGNLLFIVTCINPMVLFVLSIKFIQITFKISDIWSCRIFSYLLSVLTRSTYWMTSWISICRFFIILFPTSQGLKNHHQAIRISVVTMILLFGIHVHEIVYCTSIRHTPTDSSICVTNFNSYWMSTFNRVTTLIHYLVPFSIQMICITFLIILATRSRVKAIGEKMTFRQVLNKQFQTHKDHYIMPLIIILSALPQTILTFSLACTELSTIWRHILVVSYLLSYSPQLLGFILYVLPSTVYMSEFDKTSLAKKIFTRICNKKKNDIIIQNTEKIQTNLEETISN